MDASHIHDEEISRRYRAGEHALAIAGHLNLRAAEVIGRIRLLGLLPAGMADRRPPPAKTVTRPAGAAVPVPDLAPLTTGVGAAVALAPRRPVEETDIRMARPALRSPPVEIAEDDIPDSDLVMVNGCPRGWLVSEADLDRRYRGMTGRYEDIRLKTRESAAGRAAA